MFSMKSLVYHFVLSLVYHFQGALIFISWAGDGGEVPERAVDAGEGMEITFHSRNNHTEVFRKSLIFIDCITLHQKHNTRVLGEQKKNQNTVRNLHEVHKQELQAASIYC